MKKKVDMTRKKRVDIMLSLAARERVTEIQKNGYRTYGARKASKSAIIEALIMRTTDPLIAIKERKKELAREITQLTYQEEALKEKREIDRRGVQ